MQPSASVPELVGELLVLYDLFVHEREVRSVSLQLHPAGHSELLFLLLLVLEVVCFSLARSLSLSWMDGGSYISVHNESGLAVFGRGRFL